MEDKDHCMTCGNMGFEDKICPSCKREPKKLNLSIIPEKDVTAFVSQSKISRIPEEYLGTEWSAILFWKGREKEKNKLLEQYINSLQRVHDTYARGELPKQSFFIYSPLGFSKTTWGYSCMQQALSHNYSVAPILDTMEIQQLIAVSADRPYYRLYNEISHDDYFSADVLIMTVTKMEYKKFAHAIIMEVLAKRSRKGLGTIILSEVPMGVLASYDKTDNFKSMMKEQPYENPKKVPILIGYQR